jgi:hypothetical protein
MAELIRAVPPARVSAVIGAGLPWLAGYVVRAQDVSASATPASLHGDLGLSFPGSPWNATADALDILRVPATGSLQLDTPGDGTTPASSVFRDHPPFSGTAFVESAAALVPYWWLAPSPVPAGASLWRIGADGSEHMIAAYGHVGVGWLAGEPGAQIRPTPVRFPHLIGQWAQYQGERLLADVLPDGTVVVCAPHERDGWHASPRGLWWTEVARADLERLWVTRTLATWRDHEFQVVGIDGDGDARSVHMVDVGHDAFVAESLGLTKTDAGVYEAVVPAGEIANLREAQAELAS